MATRRQTRVLLTLSTVLGAHLVVLWLLMSSHRFWIKTGPESLQLVWIPSPPTSEFAEPRKTPQRTATTPPQRRIANAPVSPTPIPGTNEENNAIRPTPDWNTELQLAAKNVLAKELEKKKHETDFTHQFPTQPTKPPQFAWNYAATHRVEALPQGGLVVHINDNCVLLIFPLPLLGCAIGKRPANGDLFKPLQK